MLSPRSVALLALVAVLAVGGVSVATAAFRTQFTEDPTSFTIDSCRGSDQRPHGFVRWSCANFKFNMPWCDPSAEYDTSIVYADVREASGNTVLTYRPHNLLDDVLNACWRGDGSQAADAEEGADAGEHAHGDRKEGVTLARCLSTLWRGAPLLMSNVRIEISGHPNSAFQGVSVSNDFQDIEAFFVSTSLWSPQNPFKVSYTQANQVTLTLPPFSRHGVEHVGVKGSASVRCGVDDFVWRYPLLLVVGAYLLANAKRLASSPSVFYGTGVSLLTTMWVFVIIFGLVALMGQRRHAVLAVIAAGVGSVWAGLLNQLQFVWQYKETVGIVLVVMAVLNMALLYYYGPPETDRGITLFSWTIRAAGALCVFMSTSSTEFGVAMIPVAAVAGNVVPMMWSALLRLLAACLRAVLRVVCCCCLRNRWGESSGSGSGSGGGRRGGGRRGAGSGRRLRSDDEDSSDDDDDDAHAHAGSNGDGGLLSMLSPVKWAGRSSKVGTPNFAGGPRRVSLDEYNRRSAKATKKHLRQLRRQWDGKWGDYVRRVRDDVQNRIFEFVYRGADDAPDVGAGARTATPLRIGADGRRIDPREIPDSEWDDSASDGGLDADGDRALD